LTAEQQKLADLGTAAAFAPWQKRPPYQLAFYSGIQTPKNQKPHWLNPGSHTGVSW
jgi:hypothetical protein